MDKGGRMRIRRFTVAALALLCLWGCGETKVSQTVAEVSQTAAQEPGAYDSADTAILMEKKEGQLSFDSLQLSGNATYTLNVDGSTGFYDKYGSPLTLEQLSVGDVMDVQFLKEDKQLIRGQLSAVTWLMEGVSRFETDTQGSRLKLMNEWYELTEDTIILSQGRRAELMELSSQDVLRIAGDEHRIYSIVVEKGHGYLRLVNDEYFIGGWIEVGQRIIHRIEQDMLLTVPEGSYEVFLSHSGIEGTKEVEISPGQEVELDVGDIRKDDLIKYGNLIFTIEPSSASVYLDGSIVDVSRTVKTEYGLHQVMAKAEGYETVIQYIKVSQASANVSIVLDEETDRTVSENSATATEEASSTTDAQEETSSSDSDASSTVSGSDTGTTTGYKVTIEAPEGAEVYVDGYYKGIVPVSFAKVSGSHVVALRRTGYLSREYAIEIDSEAEDVSFSFSELESESAGSVSDND